LRDGSYVKGTVLLVLRKRIGKQKTSRDDLAWEIQEEVERQVKELTGLNQNIKRQNRNENVFEDADLQMEGYAAALRVLTKYSIIDGRDMPSEAVKPRVSGQTTFVDSLIEFAVSTANQSLVPEGLEKSIWDKLMPAERFILKMTDMESKSLKTLDNYQNFAKAFKVRDFVPFMFEKKANESRLKGASEFGKTELSEGSELYLSTLRAIYFAIYELNREIDATEVLQHLSFNVKDYFTVPSQREMVVAISEYLAKKLEVLRPEEASSARVLAELVRNQRLG
jgi:putative DNA methylase